MILGSELNKNSSWLILNRNKEMSILSDSLKMVSLLLKDHIIVESVLKMLMEELLLNLLSEPSYQPVYKFPESTEKLLQDNGNIKLVLLKVSNVEIICYLLDIFYAELLKILEFQLTFNVNLLKVIGTDLDVILIFQPLKQEKKVVLIILENIVWKN